MDGATIYQVCAGCHGEDASKAALGKSQIIKGWDAKKIADALNGYKNNTYGGAMKGLMAGQVSKLSDGDIKAVSEYISKL
ncbi:MAG: c-type cytochrome [Sulfurimonas sp.]|nr:c-type cytochrome [Sulfurimonas sp.]MDD5400965.1 c-type cytochrome [Sulfurimonas sp.]